MNEGNNSELGIPTSGEQPSGEDQQAERPVILKRPPAPPQPHGLADSLRHVPTGQGADSPRDPLSSPQGNEQLKPAAPAAFTQQDREAHMHEGRYPGALVAIQDHSNPVSISELNRNAMWLIKAINTDGTATIESLLGKKQEMNVQLGTLWNPNIQVAKSEAARAPQIPPTEPQARPSTAAEPQTARPELQATTEEQKTYYVRRTTTGEIEGGWTREEDTGDGRIHLRKGIDTKSLTPREFDALNQEPLLDRLNKKIAALLGKK